MCHGLLDSLLSNNLVAKEIRKKIIFKIIPMLNPDGVILGNYRTGFGGRDLNRQYGSPSKILYPTVVALKDLVADTKKVFGNNFLMYLDLHGHSVKKNVFAYGPEYPIYDLNYIKCRLLPKLISQCTDMFRFYSCIFKISPGKKNTSRAIFFTEFEIHNCFTIEASNGSYYSSNG